MKLNNLDFNVVNVPVAYEFIHVLNQGHGGYFSQYPRFETHKSFGVISPDHEPVAQLGEQRLDPFP